MIFEEFGLRYYGPIDGHDVNLLVQTFEHLKNEDVPVILREFRDTRDAKVFAGVDNAARRQMNTAQKAELALYLQKGLSGKRGRPSKGTKKSSKLKNDSWAAAARETGVSVGTMTSMQLVLDHGPPVRRGLHAYGHARPLPRLGA